MQHIWLIDDWFRLVIGTGGLGLLYFYYFFSSSFHFDESYVTKASLSVERSSHNIDHHTYDKTHENPTNTSFLWRKWTMTGKIDWKENNSYMSEKTLLVLAHISKKWINRTAGKIKALNFFWLRKDQEHRNLCFRWQTATIHFFNIVMKEMSL